MPPPISLRALRDATRRINEIGALGGAVPSVELPDTIELHLIRWNRETTSSGLFPGSRFDFDASANTITEAESIWIRPVSGGPPPTCYLWAKLTGQHTDAVAIYTPVESPRIKARITARTQSNCGNSGSGSADTDHALYTYALHSVRAVDDGDGCPTFVDDDVNTAVLISTAYEQNGNRVAVDTIVDAELVTYTDEQVSGSGTDTIGPAGCRWVFSAAENDPAPGKSINDNKPRIRYFCVNGLLAEYVENGNGGYTFVRNTGVCCGCVGSGSGPGPQDGSGTDADTTDCCTPGDVICLTLAMSACTGADYWVQRINGHKVELTKQFGTNFWAVNSITDSLGLQGGALKHVNPDGTCSWELNLFTTVAALGGPPTSDGVRITGFASSVTSCSPLSITFSSLAVTIYLATGGIVSCTASGTIASGQCATGSGTSSMGDCPCQWLATGLGGWSLIGGSAGVCTTQPADAGYTGEIRNTNADGTTCTATDETGTCTGCSELTATATVSAGTGFLASMASTSLSHQQGSGGTIYIEGTGQTYSGQVARLVEFCEGGIWYCGLLGSGTGFAAEAGGSCTSRTYNLNYTSANTLVPNSTGTATVVVTHP